MKLKYDYLSQDCIEEVLFEMNRLYAAKEEQLIMKLKEQHQQEIIKWKRKVQESYN